MVEAGLISPATIIVTTVHRLQVVDDELPEAPHDFSVDWIITPDGVIQCQPHRLPGGIARTLVNDSMAQEIPVLRPYLRP
jgi:5-formyltetrahydrofolate cyclo-ligase